MYYLKTGRSIVTLLNVVERFESSSLVTPSAPGKPFLTEVSPNQVTLEWNEPVNTGDSPVEGYSVLIHEKGSDTWHKATEELVHEASVVLRDLAAVKDYEVKVVAVNKSGEGKYSVPSDVFALEEKTIPENAEQQKYAQDSAEVNRGPLPVDDLHVVESTPESVTLGWTEPEMKEPVVHIIEKKPSDSGKWQLVGETPGSEMVVPGLIQEKPYDFRVVTKVGDEISGPAELLDVVPGHKLDGK